MIIRRVELVNFLSHRNTRIDFSEGVVAIVGPNGAGKSSIIDAISFALFGINTRGKANRVLVRLGSSYAHVKVTFEVGGRLYTVERRLDATGRTILAVMYEHLDGDTKRPLARDARTVQREVERVLGVKKEAARLALISHQGELAYILESSNRRDFIVKILGLDAIEKAYEKLRGVYTEWSYKLQYKKDELRKLRRELEEKLRRIEELKGLEEKLEELRRERNELQSRFDELHVKLEEAKNKLEEVRGSKLLYEKLKKQVEELNEEEQEIEARLEGYRPLLEEYEKYRLVVDKLPLMREAARIAEEVRRKEEELDKLLGLAEEYTARLSRLKEVKAEVEKLSEFRSRLEELKVKRNKLEMIRSEIQRVRKELNDTNKRIEQLTARIVATAGRFIQNPGVDDALSRLKSLKESIEAEARKVREIIEHLSNKVSVINSKISEIEDKLELLTSASGGRCPLCGQRLSDEHRLSIIRMLKAERRRLEEELEATKKRLAVERAKLQRLEEKGKRLELAIQSVERDYGLLVELRRKAEELRGRLNELEKEAQELSIEVMELKDVEKIVKELEAKARELEELQELRGRVEQLIEHAKSVESEIERLRERLREISHELGVEEELLLNLTRDEVERLQERIVEVENAVREYEMLEEKLQETRRRKSELLEELRRLEEKVRMEEELEAIVARLEDEVETIRRRLAEIDRDIGFLEGKLDEKKRLEDDVEKVRRRVEELQAEVDRLRRFLSDIEKMRRALSKDGLPRLIRIIARRSIEESLRDILTRFNIDFVDIKVTDDYDVILVTRDGEKPFKQLSGGEKTAIALAFRIAIARMLAGRGRVNTLILDEPTVHLDEVRKKELINILRYGWSGEGKILPQLIVVTHDREIEEAADQVIEVYKENGESKVRVYA